MNPMLAITPDEQTVDQKVVEFSESPGRRLRVIRQSRGIEIERIAQQLHLRVTMVEALEQDRYEDMAGPVFVAGYLTNYARLLGIDSEPLVAAFRAANPDPEPTDLSIKTPPRQEIGSGHILVRLISIALLVGVIALIVLWWQNRAEMLGTVPPGESNGPMVATTNTQTPITRNTASVSTPPTATGIALPVPTVAGASLKTSDNQAGERDLTSTPPGAVSPATTQVAPPQAVTPVTSTPETPPAAAKITLTFSGPTAIKVLDSTGAIILQRKLRRGDTRVLTGTPPYRLTIGNVDSVRMTVGDRPVDLSAHAKGKAARFTFDPRTPE